MSNYIKEHRENTAILIDYDNCYFTLMNDYFHNPDNEIGSKNIIAKLWEKYSDFSVRVFRAYADFDHIRDSLEKFKEKNKNVLTSLQKKRVEVHHVYSNGRDVNYRKNSADIELCLDALEIAFRDPSIERFVFVTSDSDMIPILSKLRYMGKTVDLFYNSAATSNFVDIAQYADKSTDLLSFINVEVKSFDITSVINDAVRIVYDWYLSHDSNEARWLGYNFLKERFLFDLHVPEDKCEQLFELLRSDGFIELVHRKVSAGRIVNHIAITQQGLSFLGVPQDFVTRQ